MTTTERTRLRLRWTAVCCTCHDELEPGELAEWDPTSRTTTCERCLVRPGAVPLDDADRRELAQLEKQRRIGAERSSIGRLAIRLSSGPDVATRDDLLRSLLDEGSDEGELEVLHHRCVSGAERLDHLVVCAAGVWVISTERCTGATRLRLGRTAAGACLTVNGRNRPGLLQELRGQVTEVRGVLADRGRPQVPVVGALCFVDTELPFLQRQLWADGLLVTWPKALRRHLTGPGPLDHRDRAELLRLLATSFPPAA